jgi:hypothetical protein
MGEVFGRAFVVRYCNLLWLLPIVQGVIDKSNHAIQNPSIDINTRDNMIKYPDPDHTIIYKAGICVWRFKVVK